MSATRTAGLYQASRTTHQDGEHPYTALDSQGRTIPAPPVLAEVETQLLASGARTTTQTMTVVNELLFKGALIVIKVTAVTATPVLTPTLEFYDPGSAGYVVVNTFNDLSPAGAATYILGVYPVDMNADALTEDVIVALPRRWQLKLTVADADSCTYSVGLINLP